jgi:RNA polymerase sigma-70 factor (ECF subfamily)
VARYTGLEALREKRLDGPVQDDLATSDPWGRHDRQLHAVQRVRIALEGVSDGCRDLLRSHFLEEKSHAEIASALGIPIGTVKSRIARCLKGLQRFLTRGGMEQAGA